MKLLNKILGINIPTIEDIKENVELNIDDEPNPIAHLGFNLGVDGTVTIKTEWKNTTKEMSNIFAQLIYQVCAGGMEENIFEILSKFGHQNVDSQEFIGNVISYYNDYKGKYKNLPLIQPSQALSVIPRPGQ